MAYDPQLDLLYVGTGNAETYPRKTRSPSGGDNLFTSSILAIQARTGKLAWHYQEVPGDQWDYDSTQPMILTRLQVRGVPRDVLLHAPKNGFFYVLDRRSGELLSAQAFVHVNWAKSVDLHSGRPVEDADAADYATAPKLVFPASIGAHNWQPMAFDPRTSLVYLSATEAGNIIDRDDAQPFRKGLTNTWIQLLYTGAISDGGASLPPEKRRLLQGNPELVMRSYLRAIDPLTGRVAWQVQSAGGWWDRAGVLATAGGLVFQGSATGHMYTFNSETGQLLKDLNVRSSILAAPMSYAIDGVQFVAVMAAWGGGGWFIPHPGSAAMRYGNEGRIFAFRLDGAAPARRDSVAPPGPIPPPPTADASADVIAQGAVLFARNCSLCHLNMTGSEAPDLRRMNAGTHALFDDIVLGGAFKDAGMPRWDDVLSVADAHAIHAFLISQAQMAYLAQRRGEVQPLSSGETAPSIF
jgi:quinohemoprotein ethanol dehydrogenase